MLAAFEQDWTDTELKFLHFPYQLHFCGSEEGKRDSRPLTLRYHAIPATPPSRTPYAIV